MKKLFLLLAFFTLIQSAKPPKEGIKGQVFWISGNQMPGPGRDVSPQQGVSREIVVYPKLMDSQVQRTDQFVTNLPGEPLATDRSLADGSFKIRLPAGEYSVFTREEQGLYANLIDRNGCLNCVVVQPKKFTWMTITVDYEAVY
jgi:hypothetical protein